jgi:lipopolysaccharide/colanic/teichoic acid biosynthesis glycosyltransferase
MHVRKVGYVPLVTVERTRITGIDAVLKRILDLAGSLFALLLVGLPMLVIAVLVKLTSPGPVFYRRRVMGQGSITFEAIKFRTMHCYGDDILACRPELQEELQRNGKLKEDPRVTPLGRVLRRWSLDELPQFLNIFVGQMSLVGPRMITLEEWPHYGKWQHNLLTVKPGLTGLWQVSGRSDLSYEDRVRLDMHYIRNYTLWLDLQILFQTIPGVLRGRGAY